MTSCSGCHAQLDMWKQRTYFCFQGVCSLPGLCEGCYIKHCGTVHHDNVMPQVVQLRESFKGVSI